MPGTQITLSEITRDFCHNPEADTGILLAKCDKTAPFPYRTAGKNQLLMGPLNKMETQKDGKDLDK